MLTGEESHDMPIGAIVPPFLLQETNHIALRPSQHNKYYIGLVRNMLDSRYNALL